MTSNTSSTTGITPGSLPTGSTSSMTIPRITSRTLGNMAIVQIAAKAQALDLGNPHPDSPEPIRTPAPRNRGFWQRFERGWVYWSSSTGAHMVTGEIFAKWAELHWEQGPLGFPTTDETTTPSRGSFNHFEYGSIYKSHQTEAHAVYGAIHTLWAALHFETSPLGYPTTDVQRTMDGHGNKCRFQEGAIYWSPAMGAHALNTADALFSQWASLGAEAGPLGYPASERLQLPGWDGHYMDFQHGSIYQAPGSGAFAVQGNIFTLWASMGREQSLLGFPAGDQVPSPSGSGVYQRFQHGFIISDRRGDFLVMGSEIPSSVEVASGPARPAPPSDEGLRIRIDFEAVQPRSVPAIVYPAGEPVRIDFEGVEPKSPPAPPYPPGPFHRIDFEGRFAHS